jgi:PAS domain S-box-containing protein
VLGYVPIRTGPAAGLYVSAGLSTEAAFAAIDRATRIGLLLVAVGLASAAAAALLAARLYLRPPVQRLLGAMRRWREGDTSARVGPLADRSELGRLASGFDEMADALQARTAALRESEARYHALFDASPFAVIIIDPVTHRILDFNDRTCTEYGYTREELLGMSISDIDALSDSTAIRDRGRQHAVRPGAQEFEARHRTRSGALRDVLVRVQGVVLDGRDVTYGAHFDITARKAAEAALRESEARLRLTVEAARLGIWEYDLRHGIGTHAGLLSAELPSLGDGRFTLDEWFGAIHPEDREATERAFRDTAEGRTAHFSTEFRLRLRDGGMVWIASFGAVVEHDPATGAPLRLAGIAQDITERKATEQRQVLLMREVDHRAKNALTVVQAALRLTRAETAEDYARAVEGRVSALARAHTLLAEGRWEGAGLRELVLGELSAFADEGEAGLPGGSICLDGPELVLAPHVAQALSMALHELATNAIKHGALSAPGGKVRVGWTLDIPRDRLRILWEESGGPLLSGQPPARRGFGTRVLDATIRMQLGGQVTQDWRAEGLRVVLELPHARQAAEVPFAAEG